MSTATIDYAGALPAPLRPSRLGGRPPRLRLVAADERLSRAGRRGRLRITRRGRLAVTSTVGLIVALVAASVLGLLGPAGATSSVVVEPGTTLSQIAARHLPGVPLSQAVTDIQRANSLSTADVAAGQELVIP